MPTKRSTGIDSRTMAASREEPNFYSWRIPANPLRLCAEHPISIEGAIESTTGVDESEPTIQLPARATVNDIREAISHLKRRPEGMTVVKSMSFDLRRLFDPKKIEAYEFWGFIEKEGDRIRLSSRGEELVRSIEAEAGIYHRLLHETRPYQAAAEWIHQRRFDVVTHLEIAGFWRRIRVAPAATNQQDQVEEAVLCFFHLCQAAGLGTMTMGRKGHPTRLSPDFQALDSFLTCRKTDDPNRAATILCAPGFELGSATRSRIFLSHQGASELAEKVKTAIGLADVECLLYERSEHEELTPEPAMNLLRRCDASVIVITKDDFRAERSLSENLVAEIGAAAVLHNRKVLLLCCSPLRLPESLRGFLRLKTDRPDLGWPVGVDLVNAVKAFQLMR